MFLGLLLLSVVTYALQGVLVGHLARRHDLLWVGTARGLSLLVLMAPVLLWSQSGTLEKLPGYLPHLALACTAALLANLAQTLAIRHLAMAIAIALCQGTAALVTLALEVAVWGRWPRPIELACVAGILATVGVLGWISARGVVRSAEAKPLRGVIAGLGFGVSMGFALVPLRVISGVDPFVAAWAWEGGIGVVGAIALAVRWIAHAAPPRPPAMELLRIGWCASPTLVGTVAYTLATTMGSIAVAGGVLSTMMVATALIARALHGERLSGGQWAAMMVVCALLLALGLA